MKRNFRSQIMVNKSKLLYSIPFSATSEKTRYWILEFEIQNFNLLRGAHLGIQDQRKP